MSNNSSVSFLVLSLLAGAVGGVILSTVGSPLPLILNIVVGINLAALMLCGFDKARATAGGGRVPEAALYLVALCGGSLGLLLGMRLFRHKTKKAKFQFFLIIVIAIQVLLLRTSMEWLFSDRWERRPGGIMGDSLRIDR